MYEWTCVNENGLLRVLPRLGRYYINVKTEYFSVRGSILMQFRIARIFILLAIESSLKSARFLAMPHQGGYYKSISMLKLNFSPVRVSILLRFRSLELVVGVSWIFPTDHQSARPTDYHRLIGSSHFHENVCLSKLKFSMLTLIIILYYFKLSILSWHQTFSSVFDLCYEGLYM